MLSEWCILSSSPSLVVIFKQIVSLHMISKNTGSSGGYKVGRRAENLWPRTKWAMLFQSSRNFYLPNKVEGTLCKYVLFSKQKLGKSNVGSYLPNKGVSVINEVLECITGRAIRQILLHHSPITCTTMLSLGSQGPFGTRTHYSIDSGWIPDVWWQPLALDLKIWFSLPTHTQLTPSYRELRPILHGATEE